MLRDLNKKHRIGAQFWPNASMQRTVCVPSGQALPIRSAHVTLASSGLLFRRCVQTSNRSSCGRWPNACVLAAPYPLVRKLATVFRRRLLRFFALRGRQSKRAVLETGPQQLRNAKRLGRKRNAILLRRNMGSKGSTE